jgi:hypothetical protein
VEVDFNKFQKLLKEIKSIKYMFFVKKESFESHLVDIILETKLFKKLFHEFLGYDLIKLIKVTINDNDIR